MHPGPLWPTRHRHRVAKCGDEEADVFKRIAKVSYRGQGPEPHVVHHLLVPSRQNTDGGAIDDAPIREPRSALRRALERVLV